MSSVMKIRKVMVVEDESLVAADLKYSLNSLGYNVSDVVACGEDAVECARFNKPDVVLMDIRLRGTMDGIDTARRIHEFHDIPIIFMTAYSDSVTLERIKEAKPAGYIFKPLSDFDIQNIFKNTFKV